MWLVFIIVCIAVALAGMVVLWIGSKIYISIMRDWKKFKREEKEGEHHERKI